MKKRVTEESSFHLLKKST